MKKKSVNHTYLWPVSDLVYSSNDTIYMIDRNHVYSLSGISNNLLYTFDENTKPVNITGTPRTILYPPVLQNDTICIVCKDLRQRITKLLYITQEGKIVREALCEDDFFDVAFCGEYTVFITKKNSMQFSSKDIFSISWKNEENIAVQSSIINSTILRVLPLENSLLYVKREEKQLVLVQSFITGKSNDLLSIPINGEEFPYKDNPMLIKTSKNNVYFISCDWNQYYVAKFGIGLDGVLRCLKRFCICDIGTAIMVLPCISNNEKNIIFQEFCFKAGDSLVPKNRIRNLCMETGEIVTCYEETFPKYTPTYSGPVSVNDEVFVTIWGDRNKHRLSVFENGRGLIENRNLNCADLFLSRPIYGQSLYVTEVNRVWNDVKISQLQV